MASYIARRKFLATLGGAAAAWPLAARAQQPGKIPRIGIIDDSLHWNAFRHGLRDLGYLEGQNIAFDYAYGDGVSERLAEAAAALVRRPVDVIATFGTPASFAAQQATTTIPIVMIAIGDPVRAGLVPSLARPGGNITGNSILGAEMSAKRLQLLKEHVWADVFSENRKGVSGVPAIAEEHQAHGRECPCADRPIGDLARDHRAGEEVEPHAARMGELLRSRHRHQGVSGDRQLHRCAVAPVVALQAQGQPTQGRSLSTLAPLRAVRARTPVPAWARRAVGEGVKSCPRAGCGKSACPVR